MSRFGSMEDLVEYIQSRLLNLDDQSQDSSQSEKDLKRMTIQQLRDEYERLRAEQEPASERGSGRKGQIQEKLNNGLDLELKEERLKSVRLRAEIRCLIDMIQEFVEI